MGWHLFSALVVFWVAVVAFPAFMAAIVGAGVLLLLFLTLREQLAAIAARLRDDRDSRPAPLPRDE